MDQNESCLENIFDRIHSKFDDDLIELIKESLTPHGIGIFLIHFSQMDHIPRDMRQAH